jgi:hypothetical protein
MKRHEENKRANEIGDLVIRRNQGAPLSRVQLEFNRLMKSLEAVRARYAKEQSRLDAFLDHSSRQLMPLIEQIQRLNRDLVLYGHRALQSSKLDAKRRQGLSEMVYDKAAMLLDDPLGLDEEDIASLQRIVDELAPGDSDPLAGGPGEEEFEMLRSMMEQVASEMGLELDLSDLDLASDPDELQQALEDRLQAALDAEEGSPRSNSAAGKAGKTRKPTKAQAAKERKRLELEEAKNRDLKSLFKQLAKALHPDLEPDPRLREHKQAWMQRLNSAYANSDLREMLQLEMEWLGEESTNLASAGDEKLQVYCSVLKEQIADLKRQIHHLPDEPQYAALQRFRDPYDGSLTRPGTIQRELTAALASQRELVATLSANKPASRRLLFELADAHAYLSRPFF